MTRLFVFPVLLFFIVSCSADQLLEEEKQLTGLILRKISKRDFIPGNDSFTGLVYQTGIVIDKSMLIKDILNDDSKLFLINCPRRWGKTINLDMIKTYLSIPYDTKKHETVKVEKSYNYQLFMKGVVYSNTGKMRMLKKHLLIGRYQNFAKTHLGRYPVIDMTFTPLTIEGNFTSLLKIFHYRLLLTFSEHSYVIGEYLSHYLEQNIVNSTNETLAKAHIRKFSEYCNIEANLTTEDLEKSIHFLSEFLFTYHQKKVIILVDDYHQPWIDLFCGKLKYTTIEDRETFLLFYENFLRQTFLLNEYLFKGIVSGSLWPPEELRASIFSEAIECNLFTGNLMEHYGINRCELENLFKFYETSPEKKKLVDKNYKGYKVNNRNLTIYNVWSIASFFSTSQKSGEWVTTGHIRVFLHNFLKSKKFKSRMTSLLNLETVSLNINKLHLTWNDYDVLSRAVFKRTLIDDSFVDAAFLILYYLGYVTLSEDVNLEFPIESLQIKIPNQEIVLHLQHVVSYDESDEIFTRPSKSTKDRSLITSRQPGRMELLEQQHTSAKLGWQKSEKEIKAKPGAVKKKKSESDYIPYDDSFSYGEAVRSSMKKPKKYKQISTTGDPDSSIDVVHDSREYRKKFMTQKVTSKTSSMVSQDGKVELEDQKSISESIDDSEKKSSSNKQYQTELASSRKERFSDRKIKNQYRTKSYSKNYEQRKSEPLEKKGFDVERKKTSYSRSYSKVYGQKKSKASDSEEENDSTEDYDETEELSDQRQSQVHVKKRKFIDIEGRRMSEKDFVANINRRAKELKQLLPRSEKPDGPTTKIQFNFLMESLKLAQEKKQKQRESKNYRDRLFGKAHKKLDNKSE